MKEEKPNQDKLKQDNAGDQADENKDQLIGENVNDLSEDTLKSLDIDDDGTIVQKADDKTGSDKATSEVKPDGADDSTGEGDPTPSPEAEEGEGDQGDEPETVPAKRFKDTQAAYHRANNEKRDILAKNQALRKELLEANKPKVPQTYTTEQLEDIKEDNPDLYHRILSDRENYDVKVEEHKEQIKTTDSEILAQKQAIADASTQESIVTAVSELSGAEGRIGVEFDEQPKEFKDIIADQNFAKTIQHIDKNPSRYRENDGSISPDTILMVYRHLNKDTVEKDARQTGRAEAITSINSARGKGSNLDRVPKDDGAGKELKKLDDMSQAEIAELPEASLKALLADAETQGTA